MRDDSDEATEDECDKAGLDDDNDCDASGQMCTVPDAMIKRCEPNWVSSSRPNYSKTRNVAPLIPPIPRLQLQGLSPLSFSSLHL